MANLICFCLERQLGVGENVRARKSKQTNKQKIKWRKRLADFFGSFMFGRRWWNSNDKTEWSVGGLINRPMDVSLFLLTLRNWMMATLLVAAMMMMMMMAMVMAIVMEQQSKRVPGRSGDAATKAVIEFESMCLWVCLCEPKVDKMEGKKENSLPKRASIKARHGDRRRSSQFYVFSMGKLAKRGARYLGQF